MSEKCMEVSLLVISQARDVQHFTIYSFTSQSMPFLLPIQVTHHKMYWLKQQLKFMQVPSFMHVVGRHILHQN